MDASRPAAADDTGRHRASDEAVRLALRRARLYGILDLGYVAMEAVESMTTALVEGGVEVLQLRAKKISPQDLIACARTVAAICRRHRVPFILNDHPALVAGAGADGVHVGQDDVSVAEARQLAGPWAIVGKSTHGLNQAIAAAEEGADYIGFGPLFPTPTKPDYAAIGLSEIRAVHEAVSIPIFCIGGIKHDNLPEVLGAGARRVVIVSGFLQAPDVRGTVRRCLAQLPESDETTADLNPSGE